MKKERREKKRNDLLHFLLLLLFSDLTHTHIYVTPACLRLGEWQKTATYVTPALVLYSYFVHGYLCVSYMVRIYWGKLCKYAFALFWLCKEVVLAEYV